MKKILVIMLVLMVILSGCSSNNNQNNNVNDNNTAQSDEQNNEQDNSNNNVAEQNDQETVDEEEMENLSGKFVYWSCFSGDSMEWDKWRIDEYMKEYPEIEVDAQFVTDAAGINNGKLLAAIAGGTAPDLIIADDYSSAYSYAAQGSFESWSPYMDVLELNLDDFIPGYLDVITYNDTPYLIPQDGNALMLYYNPEMFEEAGLDPNSPPETLDELDEMAEQLTVQNEDGTYERFGFIPWLDSGNDAFTWPFYFGSDLYDTDSEQLLLTEDSVVKAFDWVASYAEKYDPERIKSFVSSTGGMFSPDHPFMTGKVAMTVTGNWFTNALRIYAPDAPYEVAPVPTPEGGRKNATTLGANVFAIPRGAENPELAAHFVKFCLRPEINASNFDAWRSVPTIDASFDEVSWTKKGDEIYALERELVNSPDSGLPALTKVSAQLSADFMALRDKVIYEQVDPLPLLEDLQDKLQEEIDKE